MFRNVFGNDGQMHLEIEVGNMRANLTTGQTSFLGPRIGNMQQVMGPDGVKNEIHIGNMRQELGGTDGPEWIFGER